MEGKEFAQDNTNLPAVQQPVSENVPIIDGKLQPRSLEGLWRLSDILAQSGMVPSECVGKPATVFAKLALGMELGLTYTMALQNIAVINGKPSIFGDAGLALIHGSGKLASIKETFEGEFGHGDFKAVCKMKRKDGDEFVNEFSIDDAKRMKKWDSGGVWSAHPKRMLKWRARWLSMRDGFGDVLSGLQIYEEISDSVTDVEPDDTGVYSVPDKEPVQDEKPNTEFQPGPKPEPPEPTQAEVDKEARDVPGEMPMAFADIVPTGKEAGMEVFLTKAADMNGCSVHEICTSTMAGDYNTFISAFETWYSKQPEYASPPDVKEEVPAEPVVEEVKLKPAKMTDEEAMATIVGQLYKEYGERTSAEPMLRAFVNDMANETGYPLYIILGQMRADVDDFFGRFEGWELAQSKEAFDLAGETVIDEAPPEEPEEHQEKAKDIITPDEAPSEEPLKAPESETEEQEKVAPDFYKRWFSMSPNDFDGFVWANINLFEQLKDVNPEHYLKAKGKWNRFYPGNTFPPETSPDARQKPVPDVQDDQTSLANRLKNLWALKPDLAKEAMAALKCGKFPSTDEGKKRFLDKANEINSNKK